MRLNGRDFAVVGLGRLRGSGGFGADSQAYVEHRALRQRAQLGDVVNTIVVGTLSGGTVQRIAVSVGQAVQDGQELARVQHMNEIEMLVAPWRGTVTDVPANVGDTVTPGSVIALVADLSRLQVETTDVDEFIVSRVRAGQAATVRFDALDDREIRARVRSVSLQPRRTPEGDDHYPVVLDLEWTPQEIRPGMTARVTFQP